MPAWAQTLIALAGFGIVGFILYTVLWDAWALTESFKRPALSGQDWIVRVTFALRVAFSLWMFGWLIWMVATQ